MISIDNVSMIIDIISISVTLISIGFSVWAFRSAKKAQQYKADVLLIKESLNVESLLCKFQTESKYFLNSTRVNDWYKGIDINSIISPFKDVLSCFGALYHQVKEPEKLKEKVHELDSIVDTYTKATRDQRKQVNSLIMEITEILQSESHSNTIKVISLSK